MRWASVPVTSIITSGEPFSRYALRACLPAEFAPFPPVVITPEGDDFTPITGHERILAAAQNGMDEIFCAIEDEISGAAALTLAARDLAWFAPLGDREKVAAVGKLKSLDTESYPDEELANALGMPFSKGVFDQYEKVYRLGEKALDALGNGRLSIGSAMAITDAPKSERPVLLELFSQHIHPNKNTAKRIAENAVAVALMQGVSVEVLLKSPEIRQALDDTRSGPEQIAGLDRALYALRYPQLSKAVERAENMKKALALSNNIRLTLPKNLEGGRIDFTIRITDGDNLSDTAKELLEKKESGAFDALLKEIGK